MVTVLVRLEQWEQHCLNRLLLGHEALCNSELSESSSELQYAIASALAVCCTREQVKTVFAVARYLAPALERGELWNENQHPREKDGKWARKGDAPQQSPKKTTHAVSQSSLGAQTALQRVREVHEQAQKQIEELELEHTHFSARLKNLEYRYEQAQQIFAKAPTASAKSQTEAQLEYVGGQLGRAINRNTYIDGNIKLLKQVKLEVLQYAVCSSRSLPLKVVFLDDFKRQDYAVISQGHRAAMQLMGDLPYPLGTIEVAQSQTEGCHFDDVTNTVYYWSGDDVKDVVHEVGHWLEYHDPTILQKAVAFYEARTQGEEEVLLRVATGIEEYGDEVTKIDHFLHPYMGKVYRDKAGKIDATEIISMGLQYFFDDPGALAAHDPEYFALIYDILHPNSEVRTGVG